MFSESPDPPQDLKVNEFNGRSVSLSWSPPYSGNSPILHYIIQYKLESGRHQIDQPNRQYLNVSIFKTFTDKWNSRNLLNTTVPGAAVAFEIKNLNPVTYYHLRIYAINAIGKSDASEIIRFKTDEEGDNLINYL